jgi:WD40 repeat protein
VPGAASEAALVQTAVEAFVERHSCGEAVDLAAFVQTYPEALRPRILAQCREFLAFDGLLGAQPWPGEREAPADERRFGDFVIESELGRGGMGVVYLAKQVSLQRRVALKVMAGGLSLSKRHVERFRREAAAAAQLRHPAIVAVHSLHEVDGAFAIAMDYVAGRNLGDVLDDLRLANGHGGAVEGTLGIAPEKGYVAECALLAAQLASALAAAHAQGVVHRDLKPRNLMLDERRQARLLDFGLAKSLGDGSISMSGEITGTVHYMSPEQTLAKRVVVDHRTDVFALGVILYELLTLRRPFDGKNLQQIVYEICFKDPEAPQKHNPKVPRDLATIVAKALEKDPQNRYATAAEMEADLLRFLRWEPIHAKPAGALPRLGKWLRRHRTEAAAVGVLVLGGIGAIGAWQWSEWRDARDADRLLAEAEARSAAGDQSAALEAVTQALAKRDDAAARAKFDLYRQKLETAAKQAEADLARAASLRLSSNEQLTRDRSLAIQLALASFETAPSAEARSAVLRALGGGFVATPFDVPDARLLGARWSPDGTAVATLCTLPADGARGETSTAVLWGGDGTRRHELRGHRGWIVDAAFTPDGSRLATASVDRSVRLWDVKTGAPAGEWRHDVSVRSVTFSADGGRALTCGEDAATGRFEACAWDVRSGSAIGKMTAHRQFVTAFALAPAGELAATAGDPDFVRLWRIADGVEVARLDGFAGLIAAMAFSADGSLLAIGGQDGQIRIYSGTDGKLLAAGGHGRAVTSLVFARDGHRLLSAAEDRTARLWLVDRGAAATTLREQTMFVGARDAVTSARFGPQDQLVATAGRDGTARVYDLGGAELATFAVGDVVLRDAAFDAGGRRVLVWHRRGALAWDMADVRGVVTLRQPGLTVQAACFEASCANAITGGDDERLRAWDAHTGQLLWTSDALGNPVAALDVDPVVGAVAAGTVHGHVSLHRRQDGARTALLEGHGKEPVVAVRFAGDGATLMTAGGDGRVILRRRNGDAYETIARLELGAAVLAADLSRDGRWVAVVDRRDDRKVKLLDGSDGSLRGELAAGAAVRAVAFRPDGAALAIGSADGGVVATDLGGNVLASLAAPAAVAALAWSPDGTKLLTAAVRDGNAARLWDVATAAPLLTFADHTAPVASVAWSADGQWAITASRDGTARVWPTDPVGVARRLPLAPMTAAQRRQFGIVR